MGKYLPTQVSSETIELRHGIPAGWSEKYSGVSTRHHIDNETVGFMGARAAEQALEKANLSLGQIDMLISAGGTFDFPIPNQASVIKAEMRDGEKYHVPAIDIDVTCLSFVSALDLAAKLIDGKTIKNILVVSAEVASKGLNHTNFETTTLFGDGAAAAILSHDENGDSYFSTGLLRTYSEGVYDAMIEGGGIVNHFSERPYDQELHSFKMQGIKMLKLGKYKLQEFMTEFMQNTAQDLNDIDHVIPHSASKAALQILEQSYQLRPNQMKHTLAKYGNCIAASIPLSLLDGIENDTIKRGDTCLLMGTSAGFSIGALLLKY